LSKKKEETKIQIEEKIKIVLENIEKKEKKDDEEEGTESDSDPDVELTQDECREWINEILSEYEFERKLIDFEKDFRDGVALTAILNFYEPDIIDFLGANENDAKQNIGLCYNALDKIGVDLDLCKKKKILVLMDKTLLSY